MVLLPTSLVKDWGPLGTWWKITGVRDKGKTVQGLESYQLSRRLSSSWGQAPQASQVDAHLGGLFDLKMHHPRCLMLHHQQLSPLGCLSGHLLKMLAPHIQPLAPQSE